MPPITRDAAGRRQYQDCDLALVQQIVNLKLADVSLDEIARFLQLYRIGDTTLNARAELFAQQTNKVEDQLAKLQATSARCCRDIAPN